MGVLTENEQNKLISNVEHGEKIEKDVSLSWDGKNLILRFPKDIAEYFGIYEKNRFTKSIKFIVEEIDGKIRKSFDVIERTKPKREIKLRKENGKEKKNTKNNK